MKFREDINGMRALAVVLVLLFHFGAPGFDAGFVGVDVFFVISGFLMTGIIVAGLEQHRFSILGFYRARIARLYPALLAVVAATLAFGFVFVEPGALEGIARDGLAALLFVSNFVFLKQAGYFGAQADTMWLLHTWSLSVEWQFYLIYPIVLALAFPFLPSRLGRFALLLAGFVLSLALSAVLGTFFDNDRIISADFYMLPPRAWEMLAGGLVVLWPWRAPAWAPRARTLEIVGILAVLSSLLLFSRETPWPSFAALLPVGGTMLVLAANAPRSALAAAPFQRIGAWSYSIYLWHWPLVAAIAYFGVTGPLVAPLACAASLLAGWASYRFIEQPCRVLLKEKAGAPRHTRIALMAGLGLSTLAVSAAGAVTMFDRGMPQRNAAVAAIYQQSLDASADYRFPLSRCGGTTTFGTALRPCVLGTPSQRDDILVIGDSFAQMWYPRIAESETELAGHAVVFITKGGCPPIAELERTGPGFGCASFHRMEMEQALSDRYRTVILAGMWASYFDKANPNSVLCDRAGACGLSAGTEAGLDAAIDNLAHDVDTLHALGKTVVVLTTSPYPAYNVPAELRRRIFAGDTPPADWTFDFGAIVARSQPIDTALKTLSAHGANVIDLARLLCREMICPAARDAVPLYTDGSHLRSNYAAVVGGFLDPFIR
ncbi:MAG: acyltransferase family protein [Mesorhizobium sp.]